MCNVWMFTVPLPPLLSMLYPKECEYHYYKSKAPLVAITSSCHGITSNPQGSSKTYSFLSVSDLELAFYMDVDIHKSMRMQAELPHFVWVGTHLRGWPHM